MTGSVRSSEVASSHQVTAGEQGSESGHASKGGRLHALQEPEDGSGASSSPGAVLASPCGPSINTATALLIATAVVVGVENVAVPQVVAPDATAVPFDQFFHGRVEGYFAIVLLLAVVFFLTALFEELLFRGILFPGLARVLFRQGKTGNVLQYSGREHLRNGGRPDNESVLRAAALQALVFGLLHIMDPTLFENPAVDGLWIATLLAKGVSCFLFGLCMALLLSQGARIHRLVVVHFVFDIVLLGETALVLGGMSMNCAAQGVVGMIDSVVLCILLAPLAARLAHRER